MENAIRAKLKEIEKKEKVTILLAVESGSRAWGFASPDSDYDVRFIYIRPENYYLRLEKTRDVLEYPIDDLLDINGWDLQKALRLLHDSNPSLFEWFSSPVVYMDTDFRERFRPILDSCFSSKKGLYHYLSMAYNNYREYLRGDTVKAKKYFYVLRPVLACRWILDRRTPPPMLFSELVEAELEEGLKPEVERLLDIKMNQPELKLIPKVPVLNEYLERSIREIERELDGMPDAFPCYWEFLNKFFLDELAHHAPLYLT